MGPEEAAREIAKALGIRKKSAEEAILRVARRLVESKDDAVERLRHVLADAVRSGHDEDCASNIAEDGEDACDCWVRDAKDEMERPAQ